ncbi:MAG: hypothetical protein IJ805_00525, partial [Lachnospiraceae bacterium]|nr:hypothetical protein [Lachnospiraceae bacterium]
KSDATVPTADYVVNNGKKSDDGKFKFEGLTASTAYVVYGVIRDKAGNLSDVKSARLNTTASKSSSSSSSSSSKGGSGAAGTGGASGSAGAKNGTTGGGTESRRAAAKAAAEKEAAEAAEAAKAADQAIANRVPYIEDASDGILIGEDKTSGWDRIEEQTDKAAEPARIQIAMNGTTTVPLAALNKIKGRNITYYLDMSDGLMWVGNGLSFTKAPVSDIDFRVRKDTKNIPSQLLNEIAGVYPHTELNLVHDGDFGFTAILSMDMGESNAGMYANLYCYNEKENKLEFVDSKIVKDNGSAEFEFTHASDYTVILRGDALTEKTAAELEAELNTTGIIAGADDRTASDAQSNKLRTSSRLWILLITVLSLGLCMAILFMPDKRKIKGNPQG